MVTFSYLMFADSGKNVELLRRNHFVNHIVLRG